MPNHVETRMWIVPNNDNQALSDKEVESFWGQFIIVQQPDIDYPDIDTRMFDFNRIIPQPYNLWLGCEGGSPEQNIERIEAFGGFNAAMYALRYNAHFMTPTKMSVEALSLTRDQCAERGLVPHMVWCREHWETKWGAYSCRFDWSARYGCGDGQVYFQTAWNVPMKIIRIIRAKALEAGYDIVAEFSGELDNHGEYSEGVFSFWETVWNDEIQVYERIGDPIAVHE